MHFIRAMALLCLFTLLLPIAKAGVVVGGTRLIYPSANKEVSLSIANPDKDVPYLVQSWLENEDPTNLTRVPFVITPPLFRLNSDSESLLRIINTAPMPNDRESLYWLNVKSIAAVEKSERNQLQITVRTRIKLIYRPDNLKAGAAEAYNKVSFTRQGNKLQIQNPTPYFISFQNIKVGGKEIEEADMIAPFASQTLNIPAGVSGTISWQAINDYGSPSKEARQ